MLPGDEDLLLLLSRDTFLLEPGDEDLLLLLPA